MKSYLFAAIVFLSISLLSCSKDNDAPAPDDKPNPLLLNKEWRGISHVSNGEEDHTYYSQGAILSFSTSESIYYFLDEPSRKAYYPTSYTGNSFSWYEDEAKTILLAESDITSITSDTLKFTLRENSITSHYVFATHNP